MWPRQLQDNPYQDVSSGRKNCWYHKQLTLYALHKRLHQLVSPVLLKVVGCNTTPWEGLDYIPLRGRERVNVAMRSPGLCYCTGQRGLLTYTPCGAGLWGCAGSPGKTSAVLLQPHNVTATHFHFS